MGAAGSLPGAQVRSLSKAEMTRLRIAKRVPIRRRPLRMDRGCISICFDDIPRTAWTVGGDILRAHGARATYYLNGGLCGGWFEEREQYRREDVEAIAAAGHEIGSHLYDHVSVLQISSRELRRQIARNDRFLADILGADFRAESLAYPYGDMSVSAKWICSRRFRACRSVLRGLNGGMVDLTQIRIVPLDQGFAQEVDWEATIAKAAREKAWIVALAHGVEERFHPFSCHPKTLDRVLRLAREAGLAVLPVTEALGCGIADAERVAA